MTADYETAAANRFEVDERGRPKYRSPFPVSWGAVPADEEERRTWITDHARALPPTGKRALAALEAQTKVEQRSDPMSEDVAGLIARQKAEQAAREAQAGRFDGVLLKDLGPRVEMEHMAIAAWKADNAVETIAEPDARLRVLAARSPQASAAFGLCNAGARAIVAIDEAGVPLAQPARDPDVLASWWEPGGLYVDKWPAIPCGPEGGYFGLLVTGEGVDWFRKVATIHRPTRVERLLAAFDPVTEMGVPPSSNGGWDDDEPQPKPDELRATMHAKLWMCEDVPAHQPVVRGWIGSIRGREGQAAMAAGHPPQPRQLSAMVWSWPPGQTLPVGRPLRSGVESLAAIPAQGAVLTLGGVQLVVRQVPVLLSPPPAWVISAVGELA
jgi:hypothetical protein